jgi:ABC-2 type transport system permease protein
MQYKASFVMSSLGLFVITFSEFVAVAALFLRFGSLRGWTLPEAGLLYGIVSLAFSSAEAAARGFDTFPGMVKSGEVDRLLLRPRSTVLQLLGQEFQLMRIGRFAQGLVILIWSASKLGAIWTPAKVMLVVSSVLGGTCMFGGLFVLQATISFWTIESLELMNTMTYGGVETAQFPLSIYRPWFRRFFTCVVPLACVNFFPAMAILGRADSSGIPSAACWLAPLAGLTFLLASLQVWKLGLRHYTSTGS